MYYNWVRLGYQVQYDSNRLSAGIRGTHRVTMARDWAITYRYYMMKSSSSNVIMVVL